MHIAVAQHMVGSIRTARFEAGCQLGGSQLVGSHHGRRGYWFPNASNKERT